MHTTSAPRRHARPPWTLYFVATCFIMVQHMACSTDTGSGQTHTNTPTTGDTSGGGADAASDTGSSEDVSGDEDTGEVVEDTGEGVEGEPTRIVSVTEVTAGHLTTSLSCAMCHDADPSEEAMRDAAGRDVSPYELWRSSMKANSARDPFFLAVLSVERARNPEHAEAIEGVCMTCHAPLAVADAKAAGEAPRIDTLTEAGTRASLGADGASCVACHAITEEGLGTPESFSGGYTLAEGGETLTSSSIPG